MSDGQGNDRPKAGSAQAAEDVEHMDEGAEASPAVQAVRADEQRRTESGEEFVPGSAGRGENPEEAPVHKLLEDHKDKVEGSGKDEL